MKTVIYCRVSSKEQEETGYSLDAQEKLLTEYADKSNFKVGKTYRISESASGKQIRKTFNDMLQFTAKNKIAVILCEKIDRLTRNLKDAATISDWLAEDQDREIHFVKENFVVNKNTLAHENLVWDMKVAISKFYTSNLSEEVKKGQKEKLAQGWLPAKPPLGYKTTGEKGHKIHIINEVKAQLIREMFELYSTGNYSLNALVKVMYREGLRNGKDRVVGRSRMHKLLSDPFYYGKNRWNKEITTGKHNPIISKELFDTVQAKLTRKPGQPQYKKHLPVFKAKIKCEECGGTITWEIQKGHWYGHCNHYKNCSQKTWVKQNGVEEQLFPYFDKVAPKNERIIKWLEKALKESHAGEIDYNTQKREEFNRIIKTTDERIEKAYRDKLDGKAPASLCEKIMSDSNQEKKDALEFLSKLGETRMKYYEAGYAIHELALHAKEIYQSVKATVEDKRLLLSCVFSNLSLNEAKIRPNYALAFEFLLKWMPLVNNTFEPPKIAQNKRKTDDFASVCPEMLRRQDSNL